MDLEKMGSFGHEDCCGFGKIGMRNHLDRRIPMDSQLEKEELTLWT